MSVEIYGPHGPEGPQGPRSINWINAAWAAATDYSVDDALEHNGTTYRVTADHTSAAATEPGVGASWATVWAVVAEKGDAGAAGATELDDLTDVDLTTNAPADGDGLFFDSASGLWLPEAPAAGGGGSDPTVYKHKMAHEDRLDTVTLAADADLSGWALDASSFYLIELVLFPSAGSTSPDIKLNFAYPTDPVALRLSVGWPTFSSWALYERLGATGGGDIVMTQLGTARSPLLISGSIVTDVTAGTFSLLFAQNTQNASVPTRMNAGSWGRVRKLN